MNIYILTGYNGDLLDPVLSFSYDEIYEKMNQQYHAVLDGVHQTSSEKSVYLDFRQWSYCSYLRRMAPMADYKAAASYPRFAGKCGVSCHQGTPKESLPFVLF